MKVFVEGCCGANSRLYHRLVFPWRGRMIRESVNGYHWNRSAAKQALDILDHVYDLPRRGVRFVHR